MGRSYCGGSSGARSLLMVRNSRPALQADWSARGVWEGNRVALFDNRIVDANAPSYQRSSWDAIARKAAEAKRKKYAQASEDLRSSFTPPPLVCSTDAVLHREYMAYQKRLASRLATKWDKSYSVVVAWGQGADPVCNHPRRWSSSSWDTSPPFGPDTARWCRSWRWPLTFYNLSFSPTMFSLSLFLSPLLSISPPWLSFPAELLASFAAWCTRLHSFKHTQTHHTHKHTWSNPLDTVFFPCFLLCMFVCFFFFSVHIYIFWFGFLIIYCNVILKKKKKKRMCVLLSTNVCVAHRVCTNECTCQLGQGWCCHRACTSFPKMIKTVAQRCVLIGWREVSGSSVGPRSSTIASSMLTRPATSKQTFLGRQQPAVQLLQRKSTDSPLRKFGARSHPQCAPRMVLCTESMLRTWSALHSAYLLSGRSPMPKLWVGSGFAHSSQFSERLICDYVALGEVFTAFFSPVVLLSELDINLNTYFFIHLFIFIGNFFVYLFIYLFSHL